MNTIKFYVLIFYLCLVKGDDPECIFSISKQRQISCSERTCLLKCCRSDAVIGYKLTCVRKKYFRNVLADIEALVKVNSFDPASLTISDTNMDIYSAFNIYDENSAAINFNCSYQIRAEKNYFLMKDGSLKIYTPNTYKPFEDIKPLDFCVDVAMNFQTKTSELVYRINKQIFDTDDDSDFKNNFITISMLISCFFLFVVLVVYLVIPSHYSHEKKSLIALVSSLLFTYLLKVVLMENKLLFTDLKENTCKIISPLFYFATLSSFFWMNLISYDIWNSICRRGKLSISFMWYCLYAYGLSGLLTAAASYVDNADVGPNFVKPFFNQCLTQQDEATIYLLTPIGIILSINTVLFLLTCHKISTIRSQSQSKKQNNKIYSSLEIYLRLSVYMGVNWILVYVDIIFDMPTWAFLLVNFYNMHIGVVFFIIFVFRRYICNGNKRSENNATGDETAKIQEKSADGKFDKSYNDTDFHSDVYLIEKQKVPC